MSQKLRVITEEMAKQFDDAMMLANREGTVTSAAVTDCAGNVGCYVFIVPVCMAAEMHALVERRIEDGKRAAKAKDN